MGTWCVRYGHATAALMTVLWTAVAPGQSPMHGDLRRIPPVEQAVDSSLGDAGLADTGLGYDRDTLPLPVSAATPREDAPWPEYASADLSIPAQSALPDVHLSTRANASNTGRAWIREQQSRIAPDQPDRWWEPAAGPYRLTHSPWWDAVVRRPIASTIEPLTVDIPTLTAGALQHSSFVRMVAANPTVRESELITQLAEFDWNAFLQSSYNDLNDPIGSLLVTGTDDDRYSKRDWTFRGGVRRRGARGGSVEVFQRFGRQEDNSRFLDPNPQRTTRLELQFTQPLLKGAGRAYNQSLIVLAELQLEKTTDALVDELEAHLVQVTEAYWELYRARAEFYQRRKLLESASDILRNLEDRREVDALDRQIFRARTAVANRESEMLRAETEIRNWQSRLRLLVNDPALVHSGNREFVPTESPLTVEIPLSMSDSLHTALLNRPDISQAIRDIDAACIRLGVARKDLFPRLDFVANSYIAGLAADTDKGRAFVNQFSQGRPTYSVGFQFDAPIGNRAARAQASQRQTELDQAMTRFRLTVEQALTTVEIAVRESQTSYREMIAKSMAMTAARNEESYLTDRWQLLPNTGDSAAQLLENLLDAQERVADEERAMVSAQVNYALSLIKLKSEMGTLLRVGDQRLPPDGEG